MSLSLGQNCSERRIEDFGSRVRPNPSSDGTPNRWRCVIFSATYQQLPIVAGEAAGRSRWLWPIGQLLYFAWRVVNADAFVDEAFVD